MYTMLGISSIIFSVGFFLWGLSELINSLPSKDKDDESDPPITDIVPRPIADKNY
jgi:hypothetical protein